MSKRILSVPVGKMGENEENVSRTGSREVTNSEWIIKYVFGLMFVL